MTRRETYAAIDALVKSTPEGQSVTIPYDLLRWIQAWQYISDRELTVAEFEHPLTFGPVDSRNVSVEEPA